MLGLALIVAMAGPAGSASAAVAGLQRVSATSASNSSNKDVTASCPAGKQVVGAGGDISGGGGQVVMVITPNSSLTSVTVTGLEDGNGTTGNWSLNAYAICATPPPGLQRVLATSASNSSNKNVTASCPAGKRVLGAGGDITGGGGQVVMDDITPNSSLTSVTVTGLEDESGFGGSWGVRAYAICSNPVAGRERVSATSVSNSLDASCPAGKQVTGAGGDITGGAGQVVIDDLTPHGALAFVRVTAAEDETGFGGAWSLRAYAICANSSQLVAAASPSNSTGKSATASCPAGKRVTGGGGALAGGVGQVVMNQLIPNPMSVFAGAFEDETGTTVNWSVTAYAICAPPLPGLERVTATSASNSSNKSVTASCPSGKQVVGAGGDITGDATGGQVVLDDLRPNAALTNVTVLGLEDEDGTTRSWFLRAYAICATPPPGLQWVAATSASNSSNKSVTASCPAGKNVLGAGAEVSGGGSGQVEIDDIAPNPALTSVFAQAFEDEDGTAANWSVTAYAICANA